MAATAQAAPPVPNGDAPEDAAPQLRSVKAMTLLSLKRTFDLFAGTPSDSAPLFEPAQKAHLACKVCVLLVHSSGLCA